jgi:hypothetical protein
MEAVRAVLDRARDMLRRGKWVVAAAVARVKLDLRLMVQLRSTSMAAQALTVVLLEPPVAAVVVLTD